MIVVTALWSTDAGADVTRAQCVETYEHAQVLRRDTKLRESRDALLVCSQKQCPSVTINDCARWLAEVEALLPSVSVAARDAGGTDLRASFVVDGKAQAPSTAGQPIELDPGNHHVRAETTDGRFAELDFVARAGEQNRLVTLVVPSLAVAARPIAGASADEPGGASTSSRSIVAPVAVTAVGVLGIGAAILFGVQASGEADDLRKSSCAPHCPDSSLDTVHRNLLLSDVGLAVGVIGLAVGTYLWVKYGSTSSSGKTGAFVANPAFRF